MKKNELLIPALAFAAGATISAIISAVVAKKKCARAIGEVIDFLTEEADEEDLFDEK